VMANGERGDGVDIASFQCILPLTFIKLFANTGDMWRGVKIEMYLSET